MSRPSARDLRNLHAVHTAALEIIADDPKARWSPTLDSRVRDRLPPALHVPPAELSAHLDLTVRSKT